MHFVTHLYILHSLKSIFFCDSLGPNRYLTTCFFVLFFCFSSFNFQLGEKGNYKYSIRRSKFWTAFGDSPRHRDTTRCHYFQVMNIHNISTVPVSQVGGSFQNWRTFCDHQKIIFFLQNAKTLNFWGHLLVPSPNLKIKKN